MKKVLLIIILTVLAFISVAVVSCNEISIPKEWKENTQFKEEVGDIDPAQIWVADVDYKIGGMQITPIAEQTAIKTTGTKFDDTLVRHPAEYFKIIWGHGIKRFEVRVEEPGTGVSKYGLYYYDSTDHRVLKEIPATGSNYVDLDGDYFGVYVVMNDGRTIYSESRWNEGLTKYCWYIAKAEEKDKTSNRAYVYLDGIGVNVSFKVNSNDDIVALDYDRGPWMVICEDCGQISDNDFNDVVFIAHRIDETHIKLEYCATGATFNDIICKDGDRLGEIHDLLGIAPATMINVQVDEYPHTFSEIITVPKEFTMTEGNFGGFFILCNGQPTRSGEIVERGYAPYMIAVPSYMKWCRECISIFDAYPEFRGWAQDHTKNVDWFMHPVEGKVVTPNI